MTAKTTTAALFAVALATASLTGCGGDDAPAPMCTISAEGQTPEVVACDTLEIDDDVDIHHVPSTVKKKAKPGTSSGGGSSTRKKTGGSGSGSGSKPRSGSSGSRSSRH